MNAINAQIPIMVLGKNGSYGSQVLKKLLPDARPIYIASNAAIIQTVIAGGGTGIIPITNRHGGPVDTWELLEEDHIRKHLWLAGSYELLLDHVLVGKQGVCSGLVKHIFSHPQAYAQCKHKLEVFYPGHIFVECDSTICALENLSKPGDFAICSASAVREDPTLMQNFSIVRENIGPLNNRTTFVVISTKERMHEVMSLPRSGIDVVRVSLEDRLRELARKFDIIGDLGGNVMEWGNKKDGPGSEKYFLLLITSALRRDPEALSIMQNSGIALIPHKEDI